MCAQCCIAFFAWTIPRVNVETVPEIRRDATAPCEITAVSKACFLKQRAIIILIASDRTKTWIWNKKLPCNTRLFSWETNLCGVFLRSRDRRSTCLYDRTEFSSRTKFDTALSSNSKLFSHFLSQYRSLLRLRCLEKISRLWISAPWSDCVKLHCSLLYEGMGIIYFKDRFLCP